MKKPLLPSPENKDESLKILALDQSFIGAFGQGLALFKEAQGRAQKDQPTRFPVQVNQDTRVFLAFMSQHLDISIASLAGLILNQAVSETLSQGQKDYGCR